MCRVAAHEPQASSGARDTDKQQFNVYLPPTLIRRAKHAAIDHASSLSKLVEVALTEHLDSLERERR
jgi:predicted HicB family RNase H-like nuclease